MIVRESPNQEARPAGVRPEILVLHYTGMRSGREAIGRLMDPAPPTGVPVSSHYVVEEDGTVWRLVAEARRARHAGVSSWRGYADVNDRSIGIEIVNPGHEHGYVPFPRAQIESVVRLGLDIVRRHGIAARDVVGHSDVAPNRKTDPGELFPWRHLAACGLGSWPEGGETETVDDIAAALERYGYGLRFAPRAMALPVVIAAFQRHWRPAMINGVIDMECARLLGELLFSAGLSRTSPSNHQQ